MLSFSVPTPLTPDDVEILYLGLKNHMDRNSTFHKQASIRLSRVSDVVTDLDQRLIPNVVMQGQYGVLDPDLANALMGKLQQFADDTNDLGDTLRLLATEYNELAFELRKFMARIKDA